MGIEEETGRVATNVVAALAGTPTLLVLVLLNIGMIGAAAWYLHEETGRETALVVRLLDACFATNNKGTPAP